MIDYWRSNVRNKFVSCPARITQRGNIFTRSSNGHNHPVNPGIIVKTKLSITVRNTAKNVDQRILWIWTSILYSIAFQKIFMGDVRVDERRHLIFATNHTFNRAVV